MDENQLEKMLYQFKESCGSSEHDLDKYYQSRHKESRKPLNKKRFIFSAGITFLLAVVVTVSLITSFLPQQTFNQEEFLCYLDEAEVASETINSIDEFNIKNKVSVSDLNCQYKSAKYVNMYEIATQKVVCLSVNYNVDDYVIESINASIYISNLRLYDSAFSNLSFSVKVNERLYNYTLSEKSVDGYYHCYIAFKHNKLQYNYSLLCYEKADIIELIQTLF